MVKLMVGAREPWSVYRRMPVYRGARLGRFHCTYYQRYSLSGLVYVHEVYTGTE